MKRKPAEPGRQGSFSRRLLLSACSLMAAPAGAAAQEAKPAGDLEEARAQLKRNAAQLAQVKVSREVEPAMRFEA